MPDVIRVQGNQSLPGAAELRLGQNILMEGGKGKKKEKIGKMG